jgi:hypothetical protein
MAMVHNRSQKRDVGIRCRAAVLLAIGCWPAWPGQAGAAACPEAESQPTVSLETVSGDVVYDTSRSRNDLARLQSRGGVSSQGRGWHPIGLTQTELKFKMNIRVNTMLRPDRSHCASLSAVEASLGYESITIYIDSRYREGSCQYQSVLDHEHLHLAVFRDTLAFYSPEVERRLGEAAQRIRPISARSPEQAAGKLQKSLQREMEPLFNEMNRRLDAENNRLDSEHNYRLEQARCSQW